MKKALSLLSLLLPCYLLAQNYKCLQPGVQHYFNNSQGYLRGIRIDSVKQDGVDSVYYPFKTRRETYSVPHDNSHGSWLGSKVRQLPNGDFHFYNMWLDTVIIKTQAAVGASWTFYSDTSSHRYRATMVATDTMSFLGYTDSVKKIIISVYNGSVTDPSHPINGFEIILSKEHGFVKVFDLYMFPYHQPGEYYFMSLGIDLYAQEILGGYPSAKYLFTLTDYRDPTKLDVYNFNIGDVFIVKGSSYSSSVSYQWTYYDSVVNKTIVHPYRTEYELKGWTHHSTIPHYPGATATYSQAPTTRFWIADTSKLFHLYSMPEHTVSPYRIDTAVFINPHDTSHCYEGLMVGRKKLIYFEGCPFSEEFKNGCGQVFSEESAPAPSAGEGCGVGSQEALIFSKIGGVECGTRVVLAAPATLVSLTLAISPNPCSTNLHITANDINEITITEPTGRSVFSAAFAAVPEADIEVSLLPAGIYFVRINGQYVRKVVKN